MQKIKILIIAWIICCSGLNTVCGQSFITDSRTNITILTSAVKTSPGDNFSLDNHFKIPPIIYTRPVFRFSPFVLPHQLKSPEYYDFESYIESAKTKDYKSRKPQVAEVNDRQLSQYTNVINPGISNANYLDSSMELVSDFPPRWESLVIIDTVGKFEYYIPESDRVSSLDYESNHVKIRPGPGQKVPLYQTRGWHVFVDVWHITYMISRLAFDNFTPDFNQSFKQKTGEKSKSGSSNVSRRRNSNYSSPGRGR